MPKLTKMVATIGPASESEEVLKQLIQAGLNVARFNTKHNEPAWHHQVIQRVKTVAASLNQSVAILLDLQGPEIRIDLPGNQAFALVETEEALVTSDRSTEGKVIWVPQMVVDGLKPGAKVLLEDGACELTVTVPTAQGVKVKAEYPCTIKPRKTMNTPGIVLDLPSLTDRDLEYLNGVDLAAVDYVGLSFVRNAEDIQHLRQELTNRSAAAKIIAKIENQAALDNLDSIIEAGDAVMVARGDLAVETPFEQLAHWQRQIIARSRQAGKPVITATQMLQSMVSNPRPTRAEISDVAHAVYDGTDAVMLSEESAMGQFAVKTVETQAKIVTFTEQHPAVEPFELKFETPNQIFAQKVTQDIANGQYGYVVCLDQSGEVALQIARCHPRQEVQVITGSANLSAQLNLAFGLNPWTVAPMAPLTNDAEIKELLAHLLPEFDATKSVLWISAQTLETKVI